MSRWAVLCVVFPSFVPTHCADALPQGRPEPASEEVTDATVNVGFQDATSFGASNHV